MKKVVLVTGGLGYIGSHVCVELLKHGYQVVIFDNLSVGRLEVKALVEKIAGCSVDCEIGDIRNKNDLRGVFQKYKVDAVMHFAGVKFVAESVRNPLKYYDNNLLGTINLLSVMDEHDVGTLVFSSSCTVYGNASSLPIREDQDKLPVSPYGQSKKAVEDVLFDYARSKPSFNLSILRYFNPVGAHDSLLLGEFGSALAENLMPHLLNVASGKKAQLEIFGSDYPTKDGTAIRDYLHVMDVARAHLSCLMYLQQPLENPLVLNIGSGEGYSVLDIVNRFQSVNGVKVPYVLRPRRPGDVVACYASYEKAQALIEWMPTYSLDQICESAWRWHRRQ